MQDYKEKWDKCLEIIRDNIGQKRFDAWFKCAKNVEMAGEKLIITLPSHFVYEKYEDDFCEIISKAMQRVFGKRISLAYRVNMIQDDEAATVNMESPHRTAHSGSKFARQTERPVNPMETPSSQQGQPDVDSQLSRFLTFENYIVGASNKLPYTIAEFIAKNPSKVEFNPFFLYGDVGVGKTHLVCAIGNYIKETNPRAKVLFMPMRQFQYLLANATVKKQIPQFMNWFQQMDVLIIDDLQELAYKEGTMSALFPIFNALQQANKKLVFTCDRPPVELDGISDRLIDRFKWGVTERLEMPDAELRRKILQFKAAKHGLSISDEIISYVAESVTSSVRELEGVVMNLLTRSIISGGDITLDMAREVIPACVKSKAPKRVNFDMIVESTAEYYSLNPDVIFSKSRVRDIADARQMIMYLAKKHTGLSMPAIGAKLNRRHSTVIHDIQTVAARLSVSPELVEAVNAIETDLLR